ncbi:MAG: glycosyltransferase family 2 protein [Gammaproteobacteria bacterium]|nr:glycosyltransferase family 2 protein [Gammaproteobacteria bacterium]
MSAISVIIATFNRPDDLRICLEHILRQVIQPIEVIIVDSSPNDRSRVVVESFNDDLLRYFSSIKGLTRQRNLGIGKLNPNSEWCLFLDDDAVVDINCIKKFKEIIKLNNNDSNLGGVGGIDGNMSPTSFMRRLFLLPEFSFNRAGLKKSGYAVYPIAAGTQVIETQALNGFMMAYATKVFRDFLFDEHFSDYGYGEDLDFSCRVAGKYRLIIDTSWRCEHRQSPVSRLSLKRLFKMQLVNHHYWFRKNKKICGFRWVDFFVSEFGRFIHSLSAAAKFRSISPIIGYIEGAYLISKKSLQ